MVYPGTLFHRGQRGIPMRLLLKRSEHCDLVGVRAEEDAREHLHRDERGGCPGPETAAFGC